MLVPSLSEFFPELDDLEDPLGTIRALVKESKGSPREFRFHQTLSTTLSILVVTDGYSWVLMVTANIRNF